MPSTAGRTRAHYHLSSSRPPYKILLLSLSDEESRPLEVKWPARDHLAGKWWSWDWIPTPVGPQSPALNQHGPSPPRCDAGCEILATAPIRTQGAEAPHAHGCHENDLGTSSAFSISHCHRGSDGLGSWCFVSQFSQWPHPGRERTPSGLPPRVPPAMDKGI